MTGNTAAELPRQLAETPIAIVGASALLPGARDLREFWWNVLEGRDCIGDVPGTHWRTADYYDPDPSASDKTYCRKGGFIPEVPFYPMEFGIPPHLIRTTDVLQLLALVVTRDLLRDAGADSATWYDPRRTGVVLGVSGPLTSMMPLVARLQTPIVREVARSIGLSEPDVEEFAGRFSKAFCSWEENSFPGLLPNVVAGRIANRFDLGGTNCTVDAACASSLAAVKMAVSDLVEHRSDLMITGGCDAANNDFTYLCFSKTPALSPSGRVRPFDEAADGTLLGEGIAMLALRRLADAERDGNRIYAVIRGIGTSSDGRFTSIYAPRAEGQQEALRRAYADAAVSPESIELFEAHGTGTAVGDATELLALREFLQESTPERQYAAIGSVKSQIGHTKAAAGAAGLTKVALALHQKVLPPTINVDRPNSGAHLDDSGLYVNTVSRPWLRHPRRPRRRAAVSSFGFGGTNYHCVLEEYDGEPQQVLAPAARTSIWSAPDVPSLAARLDTGDSAPEAHVPPVGQPRIGFTYRTDEDLASLRTRAASRLRAQPEARSWTDPAGAVYRRAGLPDGIKVAALFAGQGSQHVNMGRSAAWAIPSVRAAFESANACFAGTDLLSAVVFPPPAFDDDTVRRQEESLRRTEYAQPAIGALAVGQFRWLTELGFTPDGCLGHSFGELTALWAAGALGDEEFFSLARARGRAMAPPEDAPADFDPGAMAAVTAAKPVADELLADHPDLIVCNVNSPNQIVVGGATARVEHLVAEAGSRGISAVRLPVSAAFHTPFVAHAVAAFRAAVARTVMHAPAVPVFANAPNACYGEDIAANKAVLSEQIGQPVLFAERLEAMYDAGFRVFVEFGPKSTLTQLAEHTLAGRDVVCVSTDGGPARDATVALKHAALTLAVLGLPVSDIDRYDIAPVREPAPAKGNPILLNGANRTPVEVLEAYRGALRTPYQVRGTPAAASASSLGADMQAELSRFVTQQLTLHGDYLNGQLRMVKETMRAVEEEARGGRLDAVRSALDSVRAYGETIADAHVRTNQLLLDFLHASQPSTVDKATANGHGTTLPAELTQWSEPEQPAAAERPSENGSPESLVARARDAVFATVAETTGYTVDMLEPEMDLAADLGIDSIKRVEILAALQERYPQVKHVDPERLTELHTLGDVEAFLASTADTVAPAAPPWEADRYRLVPRALPEPRTVPEAYSPGTVALVVDDGSALSRLVADELQGYGMRVHELVLPDTTTSRPEGTAPETIRKLPDWTEESLAAAVKEVVTAAGRLDACVLLAATPVSTVADGVHRLAHAVLLAKHTLPHLQAGATRGRSSFLVLTRLAGAAEPGRHDHVTSLLGALSGLVRTVAIEAPELYCRAVDIAAGLDDAKVRHTLWAELFDADVTIRETAQDELRRTTIDLVPCVATEGAGDPLTANDVLVVTGGGRGVTAHCVRALTRSLPCRLLLLGRTQPAGEPEWAIGQDGPELKAAITERIRAHGEVPVPAEVERRCRTLLARRELGATLAALGDRAEYLAVDVLDRASVATAIAPYADRITGVVHGAGVLADRLTVDKNAADVARVLATKLLGLDNVLSALDVDRLRHIVLFSSVVGVFGNRGQADYAIANAGLNRIAAALHRSHPTARVIAINWGPWDAGMVTPELSRLLAGRGVPLIPVDKGTAEFVDQLTRPHTDDPLVLVGSDAALVPSMR